MYRSGNSIGRQSFDVISGWISRGLNTAKETAFSAFVYTKKQATKATVYVVPMLPLTKGRILSTVQAAIQETLIKKFSKNQKQRKAIDQSLTRLFGNHKSIIYAFIYKHIVQLYQQANQIDLETLYSIMLTSEGQSLLRDVLLSEQGISLIATIMSFVYPQHAPNISSAVPFLESVLGHPAMKIIITDLGNSDLVRSKMRALILDPGSDKVSLAKLLVQHPQFQDILAKVMLDNGQFSKNGSQLMRHILSENGISFIANCISIAYPLHAPNINRLLPFISSTLQQKAVQGIIIRLPSSPFVRENIGKCVLEPACIKPSFAQGLLLHKDVQDIFGEVMFKSGQGELNDSVRTLMDHILSENGISFIGNCMSIAYPLHAPNINRMLPFISSTLQQKAVQGIIIRLPSSPFVREKIRKCVLNPAYIQSSFAQDLLLRKEVQDIFGEVMFKGEQGKLNESGRRLMHHLFSKDGVTFMGNILSIVDPEQVSKITLALPFISATIEKNVLQEVIISLSNSAFIHDKLLELINNPGVDKASLAKALFLNDECQAIVRNTMLEGGKLSGNSRELMRHLLSEKAIALMSNSISIVYPQDKAPKMNLALSFLIPLLEQPAVKSIISDLANSAFVRRTILDCVADPRRIQSSLALYLLRNPECQAIVGDAMLERGGLNKNTRTLMDHILSQDVIAFIASYLQKIPNIDGIRHFLDQPTIKSIIIGLLDSPHVRGKILECVSDPDRIQASLVQDLLPSLVQDLLQQPECQAIVGRVMLESKKGKLNAKGRELIAHLLSEKVLELMSNSISIVYPQQQAPQMNLALSFLISVLKQPAVKSIIQGLANSHFVRGKMYKLIHDQEVETDVIALELLRHRDCQDIARKVEPEDAIALMRHILSENGFAFFNCIMSILCSQYQGSEMNRKLSFLIPVLGLPAVKNIIRGLANSAFVGEKMYELIHEQEVETDVIALELLRDPKCQAIVGDIMLEDGHFSDNGRALMDHILGAEGIALIGNSMSTFYQGQEDIPEMIQFLTSVVQHPAMTQIILGLADYSKFREIIFKYVINSGKVFEKYKFAIAIIYDTTCQEIVRSVMAGRSGKELVSSIILSDAGKQHIVNFITNILSTPYTVNELDAQIENIRYIIQLADELACQTPKISEHLSIFHNYIRSVLLTVLSENVQVYFIDPADTLGKIKRYEKSLADSPREVVFVHKLMNLIFDLSNIFKAIEELPLQKKAGFTNLAIEGVFSKVLEIWGNANVLIRNALEFFADLEDVIESKISGDENPLENIEHLIKQDDVLDRLYKELSEKTDIFPKINPGKWLGMFIQSFSQENKENKLMLFISKLPQYLEWIATEFEIKIEKLKKGRTLHADLENLNSAQAKLKRIATDLKRISQQDVVFELNIMSLIYHGPQIWSLVKEIVESGQHVLLYSEEYTKAMLGKFKYWFLKGILLLDQRENSFFIKRGTLSTPVLTFIGGYYQKAIANIAPYIQLEEKSELSDCEDFSDFRFTGSAKEYAINELWLERYSFHQEILVDLIRISIGNLESIDQDQLRASLDELSPYMRRVDDLWYRNAYLELSKFEPNCENILVTRKLEDAKIHLIQEIKSSLSKRQRFEIEYREEGIIDRSKEADIQASAQRDFEAQVNEVQKVACLASAIEFAIDMLWLKRYESHRQLINISAEVPDRLRANHGELGPYISSENACSLRSELIKVSPDLSVVSKILDIVTHRLNEETAMIQRNLLQFQKVSSIVNVSGKPRVQLKAKEIFEAQVQAHPAGRFIREDTEQRGYFNSTLFPKWLEQVPAGAKNIVTQIYSPHIAVRINSIEEDSSLSAFHSEGKVVVNGLENIYKVWLHLQGYEPAHFQEIMSSDQIARNAVLFCTFYQLFLSYCALRTHEHQSIGHELTNFFLGLWPAPEVLPRIKINSMYDVVFCFLMAPQLVAYLVDPQALTIKHTEYIRYLTHIHGEKLMSIWNQRGSYSLLLSYFDIKELVLFSQSNISKLAKQLHALMISSTFKMNMLKKFDQIVCTLGINPKLAQDLVQSMRGFFLEVLIYSMSSPNYLRECYQDMSAFEVRVETMGLRQQKISDNISQCQSLIDIGDLTEQHKKEVYAVLGYKDDFNITSKEALAKLKIHQSMLELEARLIEENIEHLEQPIQPDELRGQAYHLEVFDALRRQFIIDRQSWFIDYQPLYQKAISQFFDAEREALSLKCQAFPEGQIDPEVKEKFDRQHKGFHQKFQYLQTLLDIVKQIEDKLNAVNLDQDWFDDKDTLRRKQEAIRELKELFNVDDMEPVTDNIHMIHNHIMEFSDFKKAMSEWCPEPFYAPHLGVVGNLLGWLWGCIYELARWFVSLCYEPAGQKGLAKLQKASMRFFPLANEQLPPPTELRVPSCV